MGKTARTLLNELEQDLLVTAIQKAEIKTSGEIRVHLENSTPKGVFDRSSEVFAALDMHTTRTRSGVLIYVAVCQQKFAIIGDSGIHSKVDNTFWEKQASILHKYFQQHNYFEGLAVIVKNIGEILQQNFPIGDDANPNELSDSISYG